MFWLLSVCSEIHSAIRSLESRPCCLYYKLGRNESTGIHFMDRPFGSHWRILRLNWSLQHMPPEHGRMAARKELLSLKPHWGSHTGGATLPIDTTHFNISIIAFICQNNVCQKYLPNDSLGKTTPTRPRSSSGHSIARRHYERRSNGWSKRRFIIQFSLAVLPFSPLLFFGLSLAGYPSIHLIKLLF